jgi:hypothetical protein
MTAHEIYLAIDNIRIKVTTNYQAYADYLRLHFNKIILPALPDDCEIQTTAYWQQDFLGHNPPHLKESRFTDFESIGVATLLGPNTIIRLEKINRRRFRFEFSLDDRTLRVQAVYQHRTLRHALQKLFGKEKDMFFSDITYYFVYYPVFWYLENFKQKHILHASAVSTGKSTTVFCGLEGMGKTTLSVGLLEYPSSLLISDNLIFYDSDNIYPCYQPIKLRPNQENSACSNRMKKIKEFKLRDFYELNGDFKLSSFRPTFFIYPFFGKQIYLRQVDPADFIRIVYQTNFLASELENYQRYARLLNLLVPFTHLEANRLSDLKNLIHSARCYFLGIGQGEARQDTLDRIRKLMGE